MDFPASRRTPPDRSSAFTWGEESKDEMGSVSLIAVTHEQKDLGTLNQDLGQRRRDLARGRMRKDRAGPQSRAHSGGLELAHYSSSTNAKWLTPCAARRSKPMSSFSLPWISSSHWSNCWLKSI